MTHSLPISTLQIGIKMQRNLERFYHCPLYSSAIASWLFWESFR